MDMEDTSKLKILQGILTPHWQRKFPTTSEFRLEKPSAANLTMVKFR